MFHTLEMSKLRSCEKWHSLLPDSLEKRLLKPSRGNLTYLGRWQLLGLLVIEPSLFEGSLYARQSIILKLPWSMWSGRLCNTVETQTPLSVLKGKPHFTAPTWRVPHKENPDSSGWGMCFSRLWLNLPGNWLIAHENFRKILHKCYPH